MLFAPSIERQVHGIAVQARFHLVGAFAVRRLSVAVHMPLLTPPSAILLLPTQSNPLPFLNFRNVRAIHPSIRGEQYLYGKVRVPILQGVLGWLRREKTVATRRIR